MFFQKYSVCLLCCSDYRNDCVIQDLYNTASEDCETALSAYSSLCFRLLGKGVTLSDYIFLLAVNSENSMLKTYIKTRDKSVYNAFKNDIAILSSFSALKSADIVSYLMKKFKIYLVF